MNLLGGFFSKQVWYGAKAKSWALHSVLHLRVAALETPKRRTRTSAAEIRGG